MNITTRDFDNNEKFLASLDSVIQTGDFTDLFEDTDIWWDFVNAAVRNPRHEGVVIEFRFDDWSLWVAWTFDTNMLVPSGIYVPSDDVEDKFAKPDELASFAVIVTS